MQRLMIAGTNSGCGKTTITCAVMQALVNRGMRVSAFKCGPDYIDPMFHESVIGADPHNLDAWFCEGKMLRRILTDGSSDSDISLIEGVMGFYDGVCGKASSHAVSLDVDCPVVLVVDCKGMSTSIGAVISGFLNFRTPNNIVGFIFNRLPPQLVDETKALCNEAGTEFLGYFPNSPECALESRKLGLVTPEGVCELKQKTQLLAGKAEQYINISRMLILSESRQLTDLAEMPAKRFHGVRIAVARDAAFSFIYRDNIRFLEHLGAEIIYFSPINDEKTPDGINGLMLFGGYPELFAEKLSENRSMMQSIKEKIKSGLPIIAECGGFMYLHDTLAIDDKHTYPMVGVIPGKAFPTAKLQRFGYVRLYAKENNLLCNINEELLAHEFHYWDSENCGSGFKAVKESSGKQWDCVHAKENMYAGFPHLYFYANLSAALRFVEACHKFGGNNDI